MTTIYKVTVQDNIPTDVSVTENHKQGDAGTDAQGNILWLALEAKNVQDAKREAAAILEHIAKHQKRKQDGASG